MGFGVLESQSKLQHVPGTSQLEDIIPENTTHLKKGIGKDGDLVLIPQPSNDPNDPLNWPLWQRDMILFLYGFCSLCCVGGVGPLVAVMALPLIQDFHIDFTNVSLLSGYQLCTVGAVAAFVSALSSKYGKRPIFLVSMVLLIAGSALCAASKSYESMLSGRIIQGLGTAAFESITFSLVGDLYFVHERGSRMAFYVVTQSGLVLLPTLIAGKITSDLSWRWAFWILTIFLVICFIGLVLIGWETSYNRNSVYNIDTSSQDNIQIIEELKGGAHHQEISENNLSQTISASTAGKTRDSLLQRMKPWSTTYTDDSLLKMIGRPFFVLVNPVILWAILIIAFSQLWNVVINFTIVQIFSPPPYLMGTAEIGYITGGPIIGGVMGCFICGALSDRLCRAISRRNNGVFEPEFRLLLMLGVPICSVGFFLFGNLAEKGESPVVMAVIWGVAFVSVQFASNAAGGYLVDAFRDLSVSVFISAMAVKNFMFFGFSFILNDWIADWKPARAFDCIGGIMLGLSLTTVPVYVFGKKLRAWWHTHDLFGNK